MYLAGRMYISVVKFYLLYLNSKNQNVQTKLLLLLLLCFQDPFFPFFNTKLPITQLIFSKFKKKKI